MVAQRGASILHVCIDSILTHFDTPHRHTFVSHSTTMEGYTGMVINDQWKLLREERLEARRKMVS
jgi:hypothetical protein